MKTSLYLLALIMLLAAPAHAEVTYTLDEDYGNVPVTFVPNVGQFDEGIVFAAEGNNGGVFNDDEGLIFELAPETVKLWPPDAAYDYKTYLQFRDANANPEVTFEDQAPWNNNYFIGNDKSQWHTDVPNYRTVRFSEIYPGVDLCMTGEGRVIVSSIIVEPHGDPSQIYFPGGGSRTVDEDGNLCVEFYRDPEIASSRSYVYEPPACVQYIDGEEKVISLKYQSIEAPVKDILTFDIGEYDPAHELIIKPGPVYSPLMLVKDSDEYRTEVADLEVDEEGCAYVAGKGGYIYPSSGNPDMNALFALKINDAGDELEYVTYFGSGGEIDEATKVTVDNKDNLYIAGKTSYTNFPTTESSYKYLVNGIQKSFVTKLNQKGNEIKYTVFLGRGTRRDLATDNDSNLYITGHVSKDYPLTDGAYNAEFSKYTQGFLTKINPEGTDIIFSTLFWGTSNDFPNCLAIDDMGNSYIAGMTSSDDFPVLSNSYNNDASGTNKIFIIKMSSNGSALLGSALISGNVSEIPVYLGSDIASINLNDAGKIIISGSTPWEQFPTTENSYSSIYNGGDSDIFVSKFNSDLSSIIYSTYLGGSGAEYGAGIQEDDQGYYILGYSRYSNDYPTTPDAINDTPIGDTNFVFSKISKLGNELLYSTYLGSSSSKTTLSDLHLENTSLFFLNGKSSHDFPSSGTIIDHQKSIITKINIQRDVQVENQERILSFDLEQPYPNPFNSSTLIQYSLTEDSNVKLMLYNTNGQLIQQLVSKFQSPGYYSITLNLHSQASGLYFCSLQTESGIKTEKLIFIK